MVAIMKCNSGHLVRPDTQFCSTRVCEDFCNDGKGHCTNLIPIEPEPTCPALLKDGKHEWMEFDGGWFCNYCRIPRPADLKPAEPQAEMPLIDNDIRSVLLAVECSVKSGLDESKWLSEAVRIMKHHIEVRLPAHDQQVRKEFAEKCITDLLARIECPSNEFAEAINKLLGDCIAHIRAMAEGG